MPKSSRKRRCSDSESDTDIERKIRKLKRKLGKLEHKRKKSDISSDSEEGVLPIKEVDWRDIPSTSRQSVNYTSGSEDGEIMESNIKSPLPLAAEELKEEILALLGDSVTKAEVLGAPLQPDVAARWLSIVKDGLPETEKATLMLKYPPPSNGTLLQAPKLNPLVAEAISESVMRRDNRLKALQGQIGAILSAIGSVLTLVLKEEGGGETSRQYIQSLSDAGRMLSDIMHMETISRRELTAYNLNKALKGTLTEAPFDEWLFGAGLEERVKSQKDMERTSLQLKAQRTNQTKKVTSNHLNSRGPFRAVYREVNPSGRSPRTSHFRNQDRRRPQVAARGQQRRTYRKQEKMQK